MKNIITILLTLSLSLPCMAQIRGTSGLGSFKKKDPPKELRIIITDPVISDREEISSAEDRIVIRGRIENGIPGITAQLNGTELKLSSDYSFSAESRLLPGINRFSVTAASASGSTKEFLFYVNSKQAETTLRFTITQPDLKGESSITVNEKTILVKVSVSDKKDLKELLINGKKASALKNSEYYSNVPLREGKNSISIKAIDKSGKATEAGFTANVNTDTKGPKIVITEPSAARGIKIIRKTETVMIKGRAEDPGGVYDVTINDIRTDLQPDGTFSLNMMLAPGDNALAVKARDNFLNTTTETFNITRKTEDLLSAGKFFALVIGINTYHGYWPSLRCPVNDAKDLGSVLKDKYGFDSIITIYDKEATRKNIIQKLEWLSESLSKDDNLLIFYAGHGQFNKNLNRGYWVPSDAATNSTADYIPNGEIRTFMSGIPAKHILLITDACFGGDIFRGKTESYAFDPNNMERYYREVFRRQSRLALTSGGLEQVRDDGRDGHSIFAYYLLKALRENKNRFMDAAQLYNELRIAVANNSDQTPILQAVKDTFDEGGQFIFINHDAE